MDFRPVHIPAGLTPKQEYVAMVKLAVTVHFDDVDKQGDPYIDHLAKVCHWLRTTDWQLKAMAWGHDIVEDHGKIVTWKRLYDEGFSERVIHGIRCGTKIPGETPEEYRAKVTSNKDTVLWKRQDLRHNCDIRRMKGIAEKDLARNVEYMKFYHELDELVKSWAVA